LISGTAALLLRKGLRAHRIAGNVFVGSILVMAGIGACVAPFLPDRGSSVTAVLTCYLVITGWLAVRRRERSVGPVDYVALAVALGAAAADFAFGLQAATSPTGELDHYPPEPFFVFAALAAFAAVTDIRTIGRGGASGARRIVRHLWRMCVALLIADFSFFMGQQQVFPASVRGSVLLLLPEVTVLALMVFWLFRFRRNARTPLAT
jgi:hypothetical protein